MARYIGMGLCRYTFAEGSRMDPALSTEKGDSRLPDRANKVRWRGETM